MSQIELQQKILGQYSNKVKEAVGRLCRAPCVEWVGYGKEGGSCTHNVLPICSDGSDCPYFLEKERRK